MEMNKQLHEKITELSNEGNRLFETGRLDHAIEKYIDALEIIPSPKQIWEASSWLNASIGDTYYAKKEYNKAIPYLYEALNCEGGIENAFILLRLGEALYESRDFTKAKEFLLKAYMLDGEDIFLEEPSKYIESINDLI